MNDFSLDNTLFFPYEDDSAYHIPTLQTRSPRRLLHWSGGWLI